MVLVIMAAGMGSRFGGLKQLQSIDNNGYFLIDYSIFDAIKAGFDEIIFVIRKQNYDDFRNTIGKRIENKAKVNYVFQENDEIIAKFPKFKGRVKPLGTGHVLCLVSKLINSPFAVINADDFYGRDSFDKVFKFLSDKKEDNEFCMVGFDILKTLSPSGEVKRGVCEKNGDYLNSLVECKVRYDGEKLALESIDGSEVHEHRLSSQVSMNMFGFTPKIFEFANDDLIKFLESKDTDPISSEFFMPSIVTDMVSSKKASVKILKTDSKWLGLTYKGDLSFVKDEIQDLINQKVYPENLWE